MPRITVDVSDEVNNLLEDMGKMAYWSKSTTAAWILGNAIHGAFKTVKAKDKIRNADRIGGKKK